MDREPMSIGAQCKDICTRIDLYIRSAHLKLDEINRLLGVEATWGFEAGAAYMGRTKVGDDIQQIERRRPSFGVWHFDTSCFTSAESLEDHALLLLRYFEGCAEQLRELMSNHEYAVGLTLWHVGPAGFHFSSEVLCRLAALSQRMSFTCWETDEDSASDPSDDQAPL